MKALLSGMLLMLMAQFTCATVVEFDDLASDPHAQIADGYAGFNWNIIGAVAGADYPGTGFETGVISGSIVAFNWYGAWSSIDLASSGTFDFIGAFFSSAWVEQELAFEGWLDGVLVYSSDSYAITTDAPNWIQLDWAGIDQLMIYNSLADWGANWAMDDFTVELHSAATVPESSSLMLLMVGLMGITLLRRRIR